MHKTYLRMVSLLVSVIRADVTKTDISLLGCPVSFKVQKSLLQNTPSSYSYNR